MRLLDALTSVDDRSTVARHVDEDLAARIGRLEQDNARLRDMLRVVVEALEERNIVCTFGGDLTARPTEPRKPSGAKFACSRCETLFSEADLRRVDGAFVCGDCG